MSDQRQQLNEMKKFMRISEGSWYLPRSKEDFDKLAAILQSGDENIKIHDQLYNVLGDDSLFDRLRKLEPHGFDAPDEIIAWMKDQRKDKYSTFPNIWNTFKLSQRHDSPMSEDKNDSRGEKEIMNKEMKKFVQIVNEGTWSAPQTVEKAKSLARLMDKPLPVSVASDKLYNLIGDDQLFDSFYDLEDHGPDTDTRYAIAYRLKEWLSVLGTDKDPDWRDPWDPEAVVILKKALVNFGEPLDEDENDARGKMCPVCTGGRRSGYDNDCPNCGGEGYVTEGEVIDFAKAKAKREEDKDCPHCNGWGMTGPVVTGDMYDARPDETCSICKGSGYRGVREGERYTGKTKADVDRQAATGECMSCGKKLPKHTEKCLIGRGLAKPLSIKEAGARLNYVTYDGVKHPANRVPIEYFEIFKKEYPGSKVKFRGPRRGIGGRNTLKSDATHFYILSVKDLPSRNYDNKPDYNDESDTYIPPTNRPEDRPHTPGLDRLGSGARAAADSRAQAFIFDDVAESNVKHDSYGATPVYENEDECDRCCGLGSHPGRAGEDCPECHGTGKCPKTDESIDLGSVVENVLQEYPGQPKDFYDPDEDDLGPIAQGKSGIVKDTSKELGVDVIDVPMSDYEDDFIDPEYEDTELGYRFD